jgi:hypothetical protein
VTLQGQHKLGRLADRLAAAERSLSTTGQAFMGALLRWHFGLKGTKPHMPARGRPVDVVRWERQIIEQRVQRALALPGVAEEVEAVGGIIR